MPASAATSHIYDIEDYRYYTTYTSTTQTDRYILSGLTDYAVLPSGGSWTARTGDSYTYTATASGWGGFSFRYGGVSGGVALDSLPIVGLTSATYEFGFTVMNNGSSTRTFTWRVYLYCWDSSLTYLGVVNLGDSSTFSLSGNGNYTYQWWSGSSLPVLSGTAYYLLGFGLYWDASAGDSVSVDLGGLETETGSCSYFVETTRNSQAITDGKLDDILSGGSAGSGLNDKSDQLDDKNDGLSSDLEDMENVQDSLPTVPDDVDDLVDDEQFDAAIDSLSATLDWEAMGLETFIPILVLGLALCVMMFVIFGKAR